LRHHVVVRLGQRRKRKKKQSGSDGCDSACEGVGCGLMGLDCFTLTSVVRLSAALTRTSPSSSGRGGRAAERAVTSAIRGYRAISPRLPARCRYTPTCSAYALQAIAAHGLGAGLRLTAGRLARCRPGVPFGTGDPVP
jgi:putative membrane protein insertion efficiency factor